MQISDMYERQKRIGTASRKKCFQRKRKLKFVFSAQRLLQKIILCAVAQKIERKGEVVQN